MLFRSIATAFNSQSGWNSLTPGTGRLASNIQIARLFAGTIPGNQQANLTIGSAVGLHIINGWAPGVVSGTDTITNRYAVLNEDAGTSITNYGPMNQYATFTSNAAVTLTSANLSLGAYQEKQYSLGTTSGNLAINYNNGSVQTATLNGDIQLWSNNFTNFIAGRSVSLILTQDGTGSHVLNTTNLKYAGGVNTLSTAANSIDVMNIYYDGTNYLTALVKGYV